MARCKTAVTPLLMHWNYYSIALSNQYILMIFNVQGWGLRSPFPPFPDFPSICFLELSKINWLLIECHIHIWQVSLQLCCSDTCQIWMWFKESNKHFCNIKYVPETLRKGALVIPPLNQPYGQKMDVWADSSAWYIFLSAVENDHVWVDKWNVNQWK